ncbi:MAG: tetratricopeptide repeat protein [Cyanobacteria bacterium P01_F01_bin.150]
MSISDRLEHQCQHYQQVVNKLLPPNPPKQANAKKSSDDITSNWKPEDVLDLLTTRDQIQQLIDYVAKQPDISDIPLKFWNELTKADVMVHEKLMPAFATYKPLEMWRDSVKPPEGHWWWFPELPEDPKDPHAWLWGGFTIALLTVSIALAQDIATRFLTGAPGLWSSIGAIAPVALALFASGGALTKVGQQIFEFILASKGPKKRHWPRLKCGVSALLLFGFLGMHTLGLPHVARNFNNNGETFYNNGQWASAQNHFERALSLQPDFPEAQFNLGVLYEEYQENEKAQSEYLKAVQAEYLPAYNNLARLYIQEDKHDKAAQLLRLALASPKLAEVVKKEPDLEYVLQKNLGWVRLKQERFLEAETVLNEAKRLNATLESPRPDAHCLLAQVLQVLDAPSVDNNAEEASPSKIPDSALVEWKQCLQYANRPEYDAWEGMARNALEQPEKSPNAN